MNAEYISLLKTHTHNISLS